MLKFLPIMFLSIAWKNHPLCSILGQTKLKKSFWSSCLVNILHSENAQTDRQIIKKRHYDRKYTYIKTCIIDLEVINYSKIDAETQFWKKIKIKSLVTWSISKERVDQKQIINFVRPYAQIVLSMSTNFIIFKHT